MMLKLFPGAGVKMEHFQAALDPRKQELLEARFLGAKVSLELKTLFQHSKIAFPYLNIIDKQCNNTFHSLSVNIKCQAVIENQKVL